jgi:hypothetical protein
LELAYSQIMLHHVRIRRLRRGLVVALILVLAGVVISPPTAGPKYVRTSARSSFGARRATLSGLNGFAVEASKKRCVLHCETQALQRQRVGGRGTSAYDRGKRAFRQFAV